jgi:hypothetical protein
MKTIKNSKEITTLEVGDKVIFGDLKYIVTKCRYHKRYYLELNEDANDRIFRILHLKKEDFIEKLGINADYNCNFPEIISLETLTALVSALFKEYEKQNELPKTWEEFCDKYPLKEWETFIDSASNPTAIEDIISRRYRMPDNDRNLCTSREEAEAFLAFKQLRQLRKAYVKDWEPDWMSDTEPKYCVNLQANDFSVQCWYHMSNPFSFPIVKLANKFLDNFKDLLEIAKPLL